MRAAVSYFYAYKVRLRSNQFSKKSDREWLGNLILLDIIVRYIRSLYRRKVYFLSR